MSESATKLSVINAKSDELELSLDSSAAQVRCMKGNNGQLKAAQAKEIGDATRLIDADQFVRADTPQQDVAVMKLANNGSQAKVCRLTEMHVHDQEKTFCQHELILSDHQREVRPLCQRAEETEKIVANIEDHLQTVVF